MYEEVEVDALRLINEVRYPGGTGAEKAAALK